MLTKSFIAHRINTIDDLKKIPVQVGVEIDIRTYEKQLILQHDPFVLGESFETFLKHYQHGTLILNVKTEGIELHVLELLKKYEITDYFFLDCSFPMINKLCQFGETKVALRFSEFEAIDTLVAMANRISWIWVDCFTRLPLDKMSYQTLVQLGYKICLVSPELQAQDEKIEQYRDFLMRENIMFDAICTKVWNIPRWL